MKKQIACVLLGLACAGQAMPTPIRWDPAADATLADWRWGGIQQFHLPQTQIFMRQFSVSLSLDRAAAQLSAAAGTRLTRLQFSPGALFLSGMDQKDHWLVQLRAARQGAVGMVSRLSPMPVSINLFNPARLAPPGARRILHLMGGDDREAESFSSFDCVGSLVQVAAQVRRSLSAAGWQPQHPQPGQALTSEWRHPGTGGLTVQLLAKSASTTLTFWHRPKEIP
ncbi:hypothetical protein [Castellaniella sp.]|uniref:hypothetical protein n=1 Tax=Castellaniella sp. TaxID=1955812 RepID=UPI002AFE3E5F|nr:hypothetical protein [Castellaniella sp.]